jgi:hypothetical protein
MKFLKEEHKEYIKKYFKVIRSILEVMIIIYLFMLSFDLIDESNSFSVVGGGIIAGVTLFYVYQRFISIIKRRKEKKDDESKKSS